MESTLRSLLKDALSDYVEKGLEQVEMSSFPMVIHDVELNVKRINHNFDESPMDLTRGRIGSVKIVPGWMGNVDVIATDIELNFSFSATKAMKNGMRRAMDDSEDPALAAALAASLEESEKQMTDVKSSQCPRFCCAHDTSEKRIKSDCQLKQCPHCGKKVWCRYKDFSLCPRCSHVENKCSICGCHATRASIVDSEAKRNTSNRGGYTQMTQFNRGAGASVRTHGESQVPHASHGVFEGFLSNFSIGWWNMCTVGGGEGGDCQHPSPSEMRVVRSSAHSYGGA
jgi:hypothetical protein